MSDQSSSSGILGVIIGAIIVAGLGLFFMGAFPNAGTKKVDIDIKPPAVTTPAR